MKKCFFQNCSAVMDAVCECSGGRQLSVLRRMLAWVHLFFCENCSRQLKNLKAAEQIMKDDFSANRFGQPPEIEEPVMNLIYAEALKETENSVSGSLGFSFRSWIFTGFFVLFSLPVSFFGGNFAGIADERGLSFLLPVGITVGLVLTCYGAVFIGSHLKELSSRFGLR